MRTLPITAGALALCMAGAAWSQQDGVPTFSTAISDELGAYVVGPDDRPVYAFLTDEDIGGDGEDPLDSCNDEACREHWPAVTADGELAFGGGLVPDLAEIEERNGDSVLFYGGHPLFYFFRDAPGMPPQGQGIYSYGGYWTLMSPSGEPIKTGPMNRIETGPINRIEE